MHTPSNRWLDVAITALVPLIWGTTYVVASHFLPPGRPFIAACFRVLPAGLLLSLWVRKLPRGNDWWRVFVMAALNVSFFQALLFVAAYRLPGGIAAVAGAIHPLLILALTWGIDGVRPRRLALLAGGAGLIGMAALLLSPNSVFDPLGIAAALISAASSALGMWFTRRWRPAVSNITLSAWQMLLGGLMLAPLAWFFDPPLTRLSWSEFAGYAYLAVFAGFFAYTLLFRGLARLPTVAVSSLGLLSPLTAALIGWLYLGQVLRGWSLAGFVLVLLSVLAMQWAAARK